MVPALVLAGGKTSPEFAAAAGVPERALAEVGGLPMVHHVLRALREARTIDRVLLVAPPGFPDQPEADARVEADGDLPANIRRQLTRIDSNGRHLLTIINEILDITRIEAGKMPMQISEFSLNELVPEVMTELDPVISRSKLSVTSRLASESPIMVSDRQKVKQVLVNLLSNALKFTHQGSIEIGVDFDPLTRMASIVVKDTGIGIAPEHHDKIFEDFRQVDDSPSRRYGGTGLGLAICRRLASALGGRITLHSTLGEGSLFTLTIPSEAPQ